jgi:hypothetical protein
LEALGAATGMAAGGEPVLICGISND